MIEVAIAGGDGRGAGDGGKRRAVLVGILVSTVIVHVVALIVFGLWVVARHFQEPEAVFEVRQDLRIPPEPREHQMNMAKHQAMTPKPVMRERLVSTRPAEMMMPELPSVEADQQLSADPAQFFQSDVASMMGQGAVGLGQGVGVGGADGTGEGVSFLGVRSRGERIVLLYDVSTTVVNSAAAAGIPMTRIREETESMLAGLGVNARFNMVQFARNYAFFREELVAASDPNRKAAGEWLERYFAVEGTMPNNTPNLVRGSPGFLKVLEAAFEMEPEVLIVISDGGFWRGGGAGVTGRIPYDEIDKTLGELQRALRRTAEVHFIGVGMDAGDARAMRRLIRRQGGRGSFKEL